MTFYYVNISLEQGKYQNEIPYEQFTRAFLENLFYEKKFSFYTQENSSIVALYNANHKAVGQLPNEPETKNGKIIGVVKVNLAATIDNDYLLLHDIFVLSGVERKNWVYIKLSFDKPFLLENPKKSKSGWTLIDDQFKQNDIINQLFSSTTEIDRHNRTKDALRFMLHKRLHKFTEDEYTLSLAAGQHHALAIVNSKFLIGIGNCDHGKLGPKNSSNEMIGPILIDPTSLLKEGELLIDAAGGRDHTVLLTSLNRLIGCGSNYSGQLGFGCEHSFLSPANHPNLEVLDVAPMLNAGENIISVYATEHRSCLVTSQNRLLVTGNNREGQLGIGNGDYQYTFKPADLPLNPGEKINHVALGKSYTVVATNQERLFISGSVTQFCAPTQFFRPPNSSFFTHYPIRLDLNQGEKIASISGYDSDMFIITNQGRILIAGNDYRYKHGVLNNSIDTFASLPIPFLDNEMPIQIAISYDHFFILTNQNRVFACGSNHEGKLGFGAKNYIKNITELDISHLFKPNEKIKQIAACGLITVLITTHNRMFGCGNLKGFHKVTDRFEPIDISAILSQLKKTESVTAVLN